MPALSGVEGPALRRILTHPASLRAVGVIVGAVLVYASLDKIARPDRFADIVHDYDMLPLVAINAFALIMPWAEMAAGAALVLGVWRRGAGLVASALSVAFLIAIAQAELRGLKIECGCFNVSGMSSTEASWSLFVRDVPLVLGSVLVWRRG
jgi:uncharacterized membrane protein YphA (DoxX/SURF4 family)